MYSSVRLLKYQHMHSIMKFYGIFFFLEFNLNTKHSLKIVISMKKIAVAYKFQPDFMLKIINCKFYYIYRQVTFTKRKFGLMKKAYELR